MTTADTPGASPAVRALTEHGGVVLRAGAGVDEVTDVVLQAPGDPPPPRTAVVLWADPDGPAPEAAVVVLRASQQAAAARLPDWCAVVAVPDAGRWSEVLERLRPAVLHQEEPADLFSMADALASAVGGAVAVEDLERRILAFSTISGQPIDEVRRQGILGRRVPEHVEREQWYARLWNRQEPVVFDAGPESSPRLALALRAGGERVGSVWVVGDLTSLAPDCQDVLLSCAPSLAAAVVAASGTRNRTREQRDRLLAQVLREQPGERVDSLLPAVVVAVGCSGQDEADDVLRARLADVLSLQAQRLDGTGLAGEVDGAVVAVIAWSSEERLRSSLTMLLQRTGLPTAVAAVSPPVHAGADLREAHDQARALLTCGSDAGGGVRFATHELALVRLARLGDALASADALPVGAGAAMLAHDRANGTSYAASLLAWLDAHGEVARAAERLHVHANTLRYRWGRAVQLFDLDLDDSDARLLLHLELRLHALREGRQSRDCGAPR